MCFLPPEFLPSVCEYSPTLNKDVLDKSNIIILNVQKLQKRLDSSILNFLPKNYFDLIIVDEAHHPNARTWTDAIRHFSDAKIVKLTGTPFRTDGQEIEGELVYNYKIALAMAKKYIKSLENIYYIPDELYLTLDDNDQKKYTVKEILNLGLKFEVYESPELEYKITNHGEILITKKHDNFANGLEVEWNYQGPWCEYITKTVNKLIQDTERNF